MKFKTAKVFSHPRSGSHYVTALISTNFFDSDNYLKFYNGHVPWGMAIDPADVSSNHPNTGHIYIHRDFDGVSKSIYKLRNRFGLDTPAYEEFLKKTYKSMWTGKLKVNVIRKTLTETSKVSSASELFKLVGMLPAEYHKYHIDSWRSISKRENVLLVSYDRLMDNFDDEMSKIANFLESDVKSFENIERKVGWSKKN